MSIIKNTPNYLKHSGASFTTVQNQTLAIIIDPAAIGVYMELASKPNDWQISVKHLMNRYRKGREFIEKRLNHLKKIGLMKTIAQRDSKGRIIKWETILYNEVPSLVEDNSTTIRGELKATSLITRNLVDEPSTTEWKGMDEIGIEKEITENPYSGHIHNTGFPGSSETTCSETINDTPEPSIQAASIHNTGFPGSGKPRCLEKQAHTNKENLLIKDFKKIKEGPDGSKPVDNFFEETETPKPKVALLTVEEALGDNPHHIDREMLEEWFVIRKRKKAPLTPIAWRRTNKVMTQLAAKGLSAVDSFERMVACGWQGMEVKYFDQAISKSKISSEEYEANAIKIREREIRAQLEKRKEIDDCHRFRDIVAESNIRMAGRPMGLYHLLQQMGIAAT